MAKRIKLTPDLLRKIVLEERDRILNESDPIEAGVDDVAKVAADEKDADEYQDTLAKDIDHMKALKIEEARSIARLKKIREAKQRLKNRVIKQLS
ncbi:MAG: hypothetical protein VYD10_00380 [Actinomycetota bacterium]|nr:hypothetical protein [Actinomycetota bacterium]